MPGFESGNNRDVYERDSSARERSLIGRIKYIGDLSTIPGQDGQTLGNYLDQAGARNDEREETGIVKLLDPDEMDQIEAILEAHGK